MKALPRSSFELPERGVHVWTVRNPASISVATYFEQHLSVDEKERAARFRLDYLRHSFIITRGTLRCLLARYLKLSPARIEFHYGSKGKPVLASGQGLEFNTAHSGDLAAFAFAVRCPVGIDVEQVRPLNEAKHIATELLCAEEAADMMSLSLPERQLALLLCWTRKEAYIKATGDGLSARLKEVCVTLKPNEPARLRHLAGDEETAREWTLHDLTLASHYVAALAYRDLERPLTVLPILDPTDLNCLP